MKISAINTCSNNYSNHINNNQYKKKNVTFQSNWQFTRNKFGDVINRNSTYFYRSDLNWDSFADFLIKKYQNASRVNIQNYACSDGSEPYTLILSLLAKLQHNPEECKKFFPIHAKDIDENMIRIGNSGYCQILISDFNAVNKHTGNKFFDYFSRISYTDSDTWMLIQTKEPMKEKVVFTQTNVLDDITTLPDENNVILLRNCWPYIDSRHYDELCRSLFEKTKNNGLLVIGDYDLTENINKLLLSKHFKNSVVPNVYEPVTK